MMTDVEADWVREHAWTKTMRQTYAATPAFFHHCSCQWGVCGHCERGDHKKCAHGPSGYQPFPSPEGYITNAQQQVLGLPTWFEHPERSATGWHRSAAAIVWLADRRCVWSCPCECRADEPVLPQRVVLMSTRGPQLAEGPRGASCPIEGCGCGGWVSAHGSSSSTAAEERPAQFWYALYVAAYTHVRDQNGTLLVLTTPAAVLRVRLVSRPGEGRIWIPVDDTLRHYRAPEFMPGGEGS